MDTEIQTLLRTATRSLCVRFGTTAPYSIGAVTGERVGYASDPMVVVTVVCRPDDVDAVVPIVRQRVFGELAERGWDDSHVANLTPMVLGRRRRKFVDGNESSESYGRNKVGTEYRFAFAMSRELARATFEGFGSFRAIPDRNRSEG